MGIVTGIGDLIRHRDHLAHYRAFAHDIRIGTDVRRAGGVFRQLRQIGESTRHIQLTARFQRLGERDEVDRLARFQQTLHLGKDQTVRAVEEIFRHDALGDVIPAFVIQHQPTQHRLLRFNRMRRHFNTFQLTVGRVVRFVGGFISCHSECNTDVLRGRASIPDGGAPLTPDVEQSQE